MESWIKRGLIAAFALLLATPSIFFLVGLHNFDQVAFQQRERRAAHPYPKGANLALFPERFERYYDDHVGLRNEVVGIWRSLFYYGLNASTNRDMVLVGKDGWLFLGNGINNAFSKHTLPGYVGDAQCQDLLELQQDAQRRLAATDTHLMTVVAPDKHSIYPEYLPNFVKYPSVSPLGKCLATPLARDLGLLSLIPSMLQAKAKFGDLVYARTDTHWTRLGAYLGYQAMMDYVNTHFFPVSSLTSNGWKIVGSRGYGLKDLLGVPLTDISINLSFVNPDSPVGIHDLSHNNEIRKNWLQVRLMNSDVVRTHNEDSINNYKVLIIRDSFFINMSDFFIATFRDCTVYHYDQVKYRTLWDLFTEKYDLVIFEVVERALDQITDSLRILSLAPQDLDLPKLFANLPRAHDATLRWEGDDLVIEATQSEPYLPLPIKPQLNYLALLLNIDAPADTWLEIYYATKANPRLAEERKERRRVYKGPNQIVVEISAESPITELRLDPGKQSGTYILRDLALAQ